MSKTLYVSDLDGTLLNSKIKVNQETVEIINELVKEGLNFTYATARSLVSAAPPTEGLVLKMPVIVHNGAFIVDSNDGKILMAETFTTDQVEKVHMEANKYNLSPFVYALMNDRQNVSYVVNKVNSGMQNYLNDRDGDDRMKPLSDEKNLYKGDVYYFTFIGTQEELTGMYNVFKDNADYICNFAKDIYYDDFWLEIMPKGATKANAILKLKKQYDCDRVVCFGDAINDISMFRIADECYAVENAVDELKKIATGVISSNEENGVAIWLKNNWKS